MEKLIWHFPSTDGGDVEGINDAGIETFEGDREHSLARECIQNSLDAKFDHSKPVRVEFRKFQINTSDIPKNNTLKEVIKKAREFSSNQTNAQNFYPSAEQIIQNKKIDVLKVSDYNTTGLTGNDDNDQNGSWFKLTRSKGINSMAGDGGGSFGIGKAAPFATSALRTVFYSTLNKDGNVAFQGKTRLSSFKDNNDIRTGVGQLGAENENGRVNSIRERDQIPEIFRRIIQGTDIFIIGYSPTSSDWAKSLLRSVLNNFWLAISENMLEIEIIDNDDSCYSIKKDTLSDLVNSIENDDENTKLFYDSVVNYTRKFEKKLENFGEVELYVKVGTGPRRVQCLRRTLMKIHTMKGLRGMSEDFAGVFIARGEIINKLLRELEPPAHDCWDKKRRSDQKSKDAFDAVSQWVRDSLKELAGERYKNPEEIPGLSRYLPDIIERDDSETFPSSSGNSAKDSTEQETAKEIAVEKKDTLLPKDIINQKIPVRKPAAASDETNQRVPNNKGGGEKTGKIGATPNPDGNTKYIDTSNMSVRIYESMQNGNRVYILRLLSQSEERGSIRIAASGDEGSFPVTIKSAADQKGNNYDIGDSEIKNIELAAGQQVKIILTLANNRRYALGVE